MTFWSNGYGMSGSLGDPRSVPFEWSVNGDQLELIWGRRPGLAALNFKTKHLVSQLIGPVPRPTTTTWRIRNIDKLGIDLEEPDGTRITLLH